GRAGLVLALPAVFGWAGSAPTLGPVEHWAAWAVSTWCGDDITPGQSEHGFPYGDCCPSPPGSDEDSNLDPSPLPDLDSESCFPAREDEEEEEERWLDALEKGELDDNGELKKEVDESLLTARQRALLHKQQSQPLLELPMGYKAKELTEEMLVKREERARKRRLQAAKKAEENKNQTIERLTKTHKAKVKALRERRARPAACPVVQYRNAADLITVSF
uniref:INO80 complex subunit B n=1 Tax=Meleagris gallopavo TaxID=9103 RepID=A0A803XX90_MELGA